MRFITFLLTDLLLLRLGKKVSRKPTLIFLSPYTKYNILNTIFDSVGYNCLKFVKPMQKDDNQAQDTKNLLSIGDSADLLNVSVDTLRRWEKKGKIKAYRSPGGHRYFKKDDLSELFGTKYERLDEDEEGEKGHEKEKEKATASEEKSQGGKEDKVTEEKPVMQPQGRQVESQKEIVIPDITPVSVARSNEPLDVPQKAPESEFVSRTTLTKDQQYTRIIEILSYKTDATKEKPKVKKNILTWRMALYVFLSFLFIANAILIYLWYVSATKIVSPIP